METNAATAIEGVPVKWFPTRTGHNAAFGAMQDRPTNQVSDAPVASLIDLNTLCSFLDELSNLVGMPTALLDLKGNILQQAGWQKACTGFHRATPASCANCTESDLFLASHLQEGEFVDYKCKNGLWDVVTPVFVGKLHLGNLYCGQFFYDDDVVDEPWFAAQGARFGYDTHAYLAAIRAIPRFTRERVRSVMGLIVDLASYLSHLSLTNLQLNESRSQMETLINALPDPVWLKDTQGVYQGCNRAFERLLGAAAAEIIGKNDYELSSKEHADFYRGKDREALLAGAPRTNEEWMTHAESGQPVLLETTKAPLPGLGGKPIGVLGIARDITERKRTEESLHLLSKVFSNSGEAIVICDADQLVLAVNRRFTKLTGYSQDEVIGRSPAVLARGDTPAAVYQGMWAALAETDHWQGELLDRRKSGASYPIRMSISVVREAQGKIVNYIGSFEDITERKTAEDKIRHLAHHDPLTGLPNRFSLYERMDHAIALARRTGQRLAVMLIDLDHFKAINDTLGHNVGDQLLIHVARRLQQSVRDSDIVARLGGDEFVVVLSGIGDGADVADIANTIVERVTAPYAVGARELRTAPSIGVCFYPDDATGIDDLIKNADIAMYRAKEVGRGNYQFYTETMRTVVAQRVAVENELAMALQNNQFVLHYQPQIEPLDGRVVGLEALVRWQHPTRGLVYPADFIAVAEESRLIIPLGEWVLTQACQQLKRWQDEGLTGLHMSVNLSAVQFQDEGFPTVVSQTLAQSGLAPACLHLEITESVAMKQPEKNIVMMNALSALGVKLALDDFGTGYSSLAYLKRFPIDFIKIDRAFVKEIETDENDAAICEMTLLLAQKLGLQVVAEGVETQAQMAFLSSIGSNLIQGYLLSKPLSADQAGEFIRSGQAGAAAQASTASSALKV